MASIAKACVDLSNGIRGLRLGKGSQEPPPKEINKAKIAKKERFLAKINGYFKRFVYNVDIWKDDTFLSSFLLYFSPNERCVLCQVCRKWRDILYQPQYWIGVTPVLKCREWNKDEISRNNFYQSLQARGFDSICLFGATDPDINEFVTNFPPSRKHIRSVSLRCSNVNDTGLENLLDKMMCVYRLELSGCNEITEAGLWSCLNSKIVSLSISDCINVADDSVGAISQLLPSLYELNLQAYHVTDAALAFFSSKQSYTLCVLRLQSCWEITNHGIVNIVHSLPSLTVLSLSGCSKITDDGVELIAENLRKLRSLDLSWCPRITDAALEYIACDLGQLEELTLDR
jgi:F-box/leucine-rich repeat protein 16